MKCPKCHIEIPHDSEFCIECGLHLDSIPFIEETSSILKNERKHVTILFSDLSGYTTMTSRLDPEEVKEIMSLIFGEIIGIIQSYDGFVEKLIGDAVLGVFGIPKTHEDDPIRAIRAGMEIHAKVESFSSQFEEKIGRSLTMHTGINTGLVVTGEADVDRGTQRLTGDAINLASRLEGIAKMGEIVVGPETYIQAVNYFEFKDLGLTKIKGKEKPINIYKVQSAKKKSFKTDRLRGLQATLTGRDKEMVTLATAVERLKQGIGSIITLYGDAGTGKSRLKKELRDSLELDEIQWREGHAYSYTQNMPYYPLIDLLTHAFQIDEGDPPEGIRGKVEAGVNYLLGVDNIYTPYIGSLFSLTYQEIENVSPEYWKGRLQESIQALLSALIERVHTIICFEDLHWADSSFIEILQLMLKNTSQKALFICTYRLSFSLFDSNIPNNLKARYQEIHLKDLPKFEAKDMLKSLLGTQNLPEELYEVAQQKAEGNPFYIEEMINSLIENEILKRDDDNWKLSHQIIDADVPATIHGVLTARIDRVGKQPKRILQEASVVGRAFLYKILERITDIDRDIDQSLSGLEDMDLIRTRTREPELEYIFKHALTQEVVYQGLLISERKLIHERIGFVIEQLFQKRIPEFYETLAFHFKQAHSVIKAVEYLIKAGQKSYSRYAMEESHQYYKDAYELLSGKDKRNKEEDQAIVNLLIKWGHVHNCRGDYKGLEKLLIANEELAKSTSDREKLGMFYGWLGFALRCREKVQESYTYLLKALQLGEEISSKKTIGYACAWLVWTCEDMGLLDEAVAYGKRAHELIDSVHPDGDLVRFTLNGLGIVHYFRGDCTETNKTGEQLLRFDHHHSDLRCMAIGHNTIGLSHYVAGNYALAIDSFHSAIKISSDIIFPIAAHFSSALYSVGFSQYRQWRIVFLIIVSCNRQHFF